MLGGWGGFVSDVRGEDLGQAVQELQFCRPEETFLFVKLLDRKPTPGANCILGITAEGTSGPKPPFSAIPKKRSHGVASCINRRTHSPFPVRGAGADREPNHVAPFLSLVLEETMAPLTQCPDCSREVSKKAETCPQCGKRLRGSFTTRLFKGYLLFLLVITVLLLGTCTVFMVGS